MRYKVDCQDRSFTEFGNIDWHFELRCSLKWNDEALKCLMCSDLVNCSLNKAYLITDWIGGVCGPETSARLSTIFNLSPPCREKTSFSKH